MVAIDCVADRRDSALYERDRPVTLWLHDVVSANRKARLAWFGNWHRSRPAALSISLGSNPPGSIRVSSHLFFLPAVISKARVRNNFRSFKSAAILFHRSIEPVDGSRPKYTHARVALTIDLLDLQLLRSFKSRPTRLAAGSLWFHRQSSYSIFNGSAIVAAMTLATKLGTPSNFPPFPNQMPNGSATRCSMAFSFKAID